MRTCMLKTEPSGPTRIFGISGGFTRRVGGRGEQEGRREYSRLSYGQLSGGTTSLDLNGGDATRSLIPRLLLADYSHHICYPPSDPPSSPSVPSPHVRSQELPVRKASPRCPARHRRCRRSPKEPSKNPCHLRRIQRLYSLS